MTTESSGEKSHFNLVANGHLVRIARHALSAGSSSTKTSPCTLASDLYMDRRRFLTSTALSVTILSLRPELAFAADETRVVARSFTAVCRYLNLPVHPGGA